jgi:hypothetical protein
VGKNGGGIVFMHDRLLGRALRHFLLYGRYRLLRRFFRWGTHSLFEKKQCTT